MSIFVQYLYLYAKSSLHRESSFSDLFPYAFNQFYLAYHCQLFNSKNPQITLVSESNTQPRPL